MIDREKLNKVDIFKVSIQAAIACNLQCEYCLVSKNAKRSKYLKELQLKTNAALEDGTYLNNVRTALKRLKQDPKRVQQLEIWGQEPTLVLPYFTPHLADWYKCFPNIDTFMFSTNGMTEDFVSVVWEFLQKADEVIDRPTTIEIQFSYDIVGEESARGGKTNLVLQHFYDLLDLINAHHFKNVNVALFTHAVFSTQVIDYLLQGPEYIKEYFDELNNFYITILSKDINRQMRLGPVTIQYMNGSYASTEDGLRLAECCERVERFIQKHKYEYEYFQKFCLDIDFGANLLGCVVHSLPQKVMDSHSNTFDEYIDNFILNQNTGSNTCVYNCRTEYCGSGIYDLKIMYDGSSITCQNYIFDAYNFNYHADDNPYGATIAEQGTQAVMTTHTQNVNWVTGTDEEINHQLHWGLSAVDTNNLLGMMSMLTNLMFYMAQCGQISNIYLQDLHKLKRHAFILATLECCYFNLTVETGSIFIHPVSQVRFLCNGLMDRAEAMINSVIERKTGRQNNDKDYRGN